MISYGAFPRLSGDISFCGSSTGATTKQGDEGPPHNSRPNAAPLQSSFAARWAGRGM